jgi:hypothetical protein
MKLSIPYEEVKARYPLEVRTIMGKLRGGSSKEKHRTESELKWEISWAQRIRAYSFIEVFNGTAQKDKTFPELYPEANRENVRLFLGDSISWNIIGKIGRWQGFANPPAGQQGFLPDEILDAYVDMYNKQIAEQRRIASLTAEEKAEEVKELLKKLRRSSGFVEVKV